MDYNILKYDLKNKTTRTLAIFIVLSFATTTMYSVTFIIQTANAQSSQGLLNACGNGFIDLKGGVCISQYDPSCKPGNFDPQNHGQCVFYTPQAELCPQGSQITGPLPSGEFKCTFEPECPLGSGTTPTEDGNACIKKPGQRVGH